jgi:hypothetical protein
MKGATAVVCLAGAVVSAGAQAPFSHQAFDARAPIVREHTYQVNAQIRPLLLFWIGRDDVGEARLAWRAGSDGRRAFEFLIGSDPDRAPRKINRWGFIVEELTADGAQVLGLMSESNEQTIEEAEAEIARQNGVAAFRASRTVIAGDEAVNRTMRVDAPAHLTYRDLDALLALLPATSTNERTVRVPPGTERGFLSAIDGLLQASVGPCATKQGARGVHGVHYLYNRTVFDLALESCKHERELRVHKHTFTDIVDGRFYIRNRTTKNKTEFRILYGTAGDLRAVPVRAVFRPRWWMEVELVLNPTKSST